MEDMPKSPLKFRGALGLATTKDSPLEKTSRVRVVMKGLVLQQLTILEKNTGFALEFTGNEGSNPLNMCRATW